MRSHLATEHLSAYLNDELPDREQRLVEAHVSHCSACKGRLHGLRLVVSELHRVPVVEAPPSLARSIEAEAALRWGPDPPRGGRLLGRRGLALLQDMIQLSAATAGAVAIIALLIAYASTRDTQPNDAGLAVGGIAVGALDQVEAGGRSFFFRDGVWWQQGLPPGLESSSRPAPTLPVQDALARAPWIARLLRRGPVVFELDGAVQIVDLETRAPSPRAAPPPPPAAAAPQTRAGEIVTTR